MPQNMTKFTVRLPDTAVAEIDASTTPSCVLLRNLVLSCTGLVRIVVIGLLLRTKRRWYAL